MIISSTFSTFHLLFVVYKDVAMIPLCILQSQLGKRHSPCFVGEFMLMKFPSSGVVPELSHVLEQATCMIVHWIVKAICLFLTIELASSARNS